MVTNNHKQIEALIKLIHNVFDCVLISSYIFENLSQLMILIIVFYNLRQATYLRQWKSITTIYIYLCLRQLMK